jgi:hypothetical protein
VRTSLAVRPLVSRDGRVDGDAQRLYRGAAGEPGDYVVEAFVLQFEVTAA